jgi:hypothetical protein
MQTSPMDGKDYNMRHQVKDNEPTGSPYNLPHRIGQTLLGKNSSEDFLRSHGSYPCEIQSTENIEEAGKVFDGDKVIVTQYTPSEEAQKQTWREGASLGPVQLRRALRHLNLKDQVDAYILTLPEEIQEEWAVSTLYKRLDQMILAAQAEFEMTDEEMDALFELGQTLA